MGLLFNNDGTINKKELDSFISDLQEADRCRDLEITRRENRIEEIDVELEAIKKNLDFMAGLGYSAMHSSMGVLGVIREENKLDDRKAALLKEREELTDKYTLYGGNVNMATDIERSKRLLEIDERMKEIHNHLQNLAQFEVNGYYGTITPVTVKEVFVRQDVLKDELKTLKIEKNELVGKINM